MQIFCCLNFQKSKNSQFIFQHNPEAPVESQAKSKDVLEIDALVKNISPVEATDLLTNAQKFKSLVEKIKSPKDNQTLTEVAEKLLAKIMTDEASLEKVLDYLIGNQLASYYVNYHVLKKLFKYIRPQNPDVFFRNVANRLNSDLDLMALAISKLPNENERVEECKKILARLSTPEYQAKLFEAIEKTALMRFMLRQGGKPAPTKGVIETSEMEFAYSVIRTIKSGFALNELSAFVQDIKAPSKDDEAAIEKQKKNLLALIFDQRQVTRK
jgi:hypothetical protein